MKTATLYSLALSGLLLIGASLSVDVRAEEPKASDQQKEQLMQGVNELKQRLNLTAEQEEQIVAIFEESAEQSRKVFEEYGLGEGEGMAGLSRKQKRALMKDVKASRNARSEKIEVVLNDDQKAEYQKIKEENRQKMRDRMRNRQR